MPDLRFELRLPKDTGFEPAASAIPPEGQYKFYDVLQRARHHKTGIRVAPVLGLEPRQRGFGDLPGDPRQTDITGRSGQIPAPAIPEFVINDVKEHSPKTG